MLSRILNHVFPETCVQCAIDLGDRGPFPLCDACRTDLKAWPPGPSYPLPGLPVHAAFRYDPLCARLIRKFKTTPRPWLGNPLGKEIARVALEVPSLPEAWVPVPPSPDLAQDRGFNQAFLLARRVGIETGRPVILPLRKKRSRPPQKSLKRLRRLSLLRKKILECAPEDLRGMSLGLVDDVCTTGATLAACALLLRERGAREVSGWVFARVEARAFKKARRKNRAAV